MNDRFVIISTGEQTAVGSLSVVPQASTLRVTYAWHAACVQPLSAFAMPRSYRDLSVVYGISNCTYVDLPFPVHRWARARMQIPIYGQFDEFSFDRVEVILLIRLLCTCSNKLPNCCANHIENYRHKGE